jgi:hypothetical protein
MGGNYRGANPDNYVLPGRFSVWVRPRGSSADADWHEFGNIVDPSFEPRVERQDHQSFRRGVRAVDKSIISGRGGTFSFTVDEMNDRNLQYAFGNAATPEETTVDTHESKTFANPGADGVLNLGDVDIKIGSVIVRSADLEEDVVFVKDDDYTVDEVNGTLTVKAGTKGLNDKEIYPYIHITYIKNVVAEKFEIVPETEVELEAKIQSLPEEGKQFLLHAKKSVLKNNGALSFGGGGEGFQSVPLQLEFLVDDEGDVGDCYLIDRDELD